MQALCCINRKGAVLYEYYNEKRFLWLLGWATTSKAAADFMAFVFAYSSVFFVNDMSRLEIKMCSFLARCYVHGKMICSSHISQERLPDQYSPPFTAWILVEARKDLDMRI